MFRKSILFAAILIILSACSTSTSTESTQSESPTNESQPSPPEPPSKEGPRNSTDDDGEFVNANLGVPFRLAAGQTGQLEGFGMEIAFMHVNADSRCPSDVQCIWAGQVVLAMEFKQGGELIDEFELVFGDLREEGDSPGWEHDGFVIMLMDVSPYPESTEAIEQEDYRIELVVMTIDPPP